MTENLIVRRAIPSRDNFSIDSVVADRAYPPPNLVLVTLIRQVTAFFSVVGWALALGANNSFGRTSYCCWEPQYAHFRTIMREVTVGVTKQPWAEPLDYPPFGLFLFIPWLHLGQ